MAEFHRPVAYKIWISDLLNGSYGRGSDQFDVGYIEVLGMKISKVNIIGSIVDKFSGENNITLTIDDGSGNLRIKAWGEDSKVFNEMNIGDLVLAIGKVKEYNNNIFITPDVIKKLDNPLWLKVRRLELIKMYGETKRAETEQINEDNNEGPGSLIVEDVVNEDFDIKDKVFSLIEGMDNGEGADIENVVNQSGNADDARRAIEDMIKEGEIFEFRKGKLRIMS